jgi:hypothetical protein
MIRQAYFEYALHQELLTHRQHMTDVERENAYLLLEALRATRTSFEGAQDVSQVRMFPGCGNPRCIRPSHQVAVFNGELIPRQLPVVTLNETFEAHKASGIPKKLRLPQPTNFDPARPLPEPGSVRYSRDELPVDDLAWGMVEKWWFEVLPRMGRVAEHPAGMDVITPGNTSHASYQHVLVSRPTLWRFMSNAGRHGHSVTLPYALAEAKLWGSRQTHDHCITQTQEPTS